MSLITQHNATDALLLKVQQYLRLTEVERKALAELPFRVERINSGAHTVNDGDKPETSQMVLSGILATSKTLANGGRQIAAVHIKGDWPDLLALHLGHMDSDLRALTNAVVGFVEHGAIRKMCRLQPRLNDLFWKFTLIDAAVFRHWVVNVGQRAAEPRLAHFICEYFTRAEHMDLLDGDSCNLPLTQTDVAEATGLSAVHVNRSLQSLRARQLISWQKGRLTIHDRNGLEALADFWPDYLHLPPTG